MWADEAAMRQFMMSGPHRRVMPRLIEWCDEAALVHWLQETTDVPSTRGTRAISLTLPRNAGQTTHVVLTKGPSKRRTMRR